MGAPLNSNPKPIISFGTIANRPSPNGVAAGDMYYALDLGAMFICVKTPSGIAPGFSSSWQLTDGLTPEPKITTVDATPEVITVPLPADGSYNVDCEINVFEPSGGAGAWFNFTAAYRVRLGVASLITGAPVTLGTGTDGPLVGITAVLTAAGSDVVLTLTGLAATTINWGVQFKILQAPA